MITETFLNNCLSLVFSKKSNELEISAYQDIGFCLATFEKAFVDNIPVMLKNKFDLLKMICANMIKGGSLPEIMVSVAASGKYQQFVDLIQVKSATPLDNKAQTGHLNALQQLVAYMKVCGEDKKWHDYFDKVNSGNIETIEEVIGEYKNLVKASFNDVADFEIKSSLGLVTSLNAPNDDCSRIIEEIQKKYSPQNVISSGIKELDEEFLSGGYQPSRIYLYAGISGVGKSILLLNMAIRGAMSRLNQEDSIFSYGPTIDSEPQRVFLYVTCENYVYETWMRLYFALTKTRKEELLTKLRAGSITSKDIQMEITRILEPYNCAIQIEYFPSNSISPGNIAALIQKYNRNPQSRVVKAVYLDYLDLLLPDEKEELRWVDLGAITTRLKTISASFEIPIITATQLNREAYRKGKGGDKESDSGMETISESIQKVFIADFGAIIQREKKIESNGDQPPKPVKIYLSVEKNRDGKTGKTNLYFDYPCFRILTNEEYREEFGEVMKI